MTIHAIICTRTAETVSQTTDKLFQFLVSCGIQISVMSGAKSIFKAYQGAFDRLNPADDDICIFCHDDIELRENPVEFVNKLKAACSLPETGFVGAAGTTHLSENAVWWDQNMWQQGKHKGKVWHIQTEPGMLNNVKITEYLTTYGPPDDVVALDGLFLAARADVIRKIGLQKPEYFEGEWDFYDIHYTTTAFKEGYTNKVMDLNILHNSRGELVGRDSWHKNRAAFIANNELPMKIEE
jgi:hypothetical protein